MKIVLHICCGVCAAGVAERLITEGHEIRGFFYNPNIYPPAEYQRRLEAARRVADELNFPLEVGAYDTDEWSAATESLQDEPEGGRRCQVCFRLRLEETYRYLQDGGGDALTTTLTISPHKSADIINHIGQKIAGEKFLVRDFKKKAGFQRAIELAGEWNLHRQHYCGCRYSLRG